MMTMMWWPLKCNLAQLIDENINSTSTSEVIIETKKAIRGLHFYAVWMNSDENLDCFYLPDESSSCTASSVV